MKDILSLRDLRIIGQLGDTILLIVRKEEVDNDRTESVSLHLGKGKFDKDEIGKLLKFIPYEGVDPNDEASQKYYRGLINRKVKDDVILEILIELDKE